MIKGGILRLLVVVMLLVRGSCSFWWWGHKGKDETDSTSVDPTMSTLLFDCTFENTTSYTSLATVRNITNTTEILCQAFVEISGDLEYPNTSRGDERAFCNHLGGTVCPNCTNDTSYEDVGQNINTSCAKEETTTMSVTTADFSIQPRNTEAAINKQNSTTTTKHIKAAMTTTSIIAVVAGIVIFILLAVVIFFMCKRKRMPKESKATFQNGPTSQVVRLETNETGELYAVLDREQNGTGVVTNEGPLYDAPHDVEVVENAALYTEVNINDGRNGASALETTRNDADDDKKKKQDGQRQRNAIKDVAHESRPGQPMDVEDTQLYNVLHQPGSAGENDALYSVLNAKR